MSSKEAEQLKRKWFLFILIAPGIFFIVYWLIIQTGDSINTVKLKPPEKYVPLGQEVVVKGDSYMTGSGKKIFTNTVALHNNTIIAEPKRVFMGLGLKTNLTVNNKNVRVIDSSGNPYSPVAVDEAIIANNFGLDNQNSKLYLFKVDSGANYFFFQVQNNPSLTWKIKNNYNKS